jgi:hypothetical protein
LIGWESIDLKSKRIRVDGCFLDNVDGCGRAVEALPGAALTRQDFLFEPESFKNRCLAVSGNPDAFHSKAAPAEFLFPSPDGPHRHLQNFGEFFSGYCFSERHAAFDATRPRRDWKVI